MCHVVPWVLFLWLLRSLFPCFLVVGLFESVVRFVCLFFRSRVLAGYFSFYFVVRFSLLVVLGNYGPCIFLGGIDIFPRFLRFFGLRMCFLARIFGRFFPSFLIVVPGLGFFCGGCLFWVFFAISVVLGGTIFDFLGEIVVVVVVGYYFIIVVVVWAGKILITIIVVNCCFLEYTVAIIIVFIVVKLHLLRYRCPWR